MKPISDTKNLTRTMWLVGGVAWAIMSPSAGAGSVNPDVVIDGTPAVALTDKGTDIALPAQAVTGIDVRPASNQISIAITGDGRLFPETKLHD
jgi:hypothetical protein